MRRKGIKRDRERERARYREMEREKERDHNTVALTYVHSAVWQYDARRPEHILHVAGRADKEGRQRRPIDCRAMFGRVASIGARPPRRSIDVVSRWTSQVSSGQSSGSAQRERKRRGQTGEIMGGAEVVFFIASATRGPTVQQRRRAPPITTVTRGSNTTVPRGWRGCRGQAART